MTTYKKKWRCPDPSQLKIRGDFDTAAADQFQINIKRCSKESLEKLNSTEECASDAEIDQWLSNKYILLAYN